MSFTYYVNIYDIKCMLVDKKKPKKHLNCASDYAIILFFPFQVTVLLVMFTQLQEEANLVMIRHLIT